MNIVFDVDGTICFNGQTIDKALIKEIQKLEEKHKVIFASARPIRDLLPIVKDFNQEMMIGGNGSIISVNGNIKVIQHIPLKAYEAIKRLIKTFQLNYIIDDTFNYSAQVDEQNPIFQQLDPSDKAQNIQIEKIVKPIKIILINIPFQDFESIKSQLRDFQDELSILYHETEGNIDITAKGINKYTTLKQLIGETPYIAFGNDINDYEMLQHAMSSFFVSSQSTTLPFENATIVQPHSKAIIDSIRIFELERNK